MSEYREQVFDETKATYREIDIPLDETDYSERKRDSLNHFGRY